MTRRLFHTRVLQLFALLFAVMAGSPAFAQARGGGDRVAVEVLVVAATNDHSNVDSRLRSLMPHLKHLSYTGYDLLDTREQTLSPGGEASFGIAGGRRLEVELLEVDDRRARLRVRMFRNARNLLDTTVSIHRNRSFIVAGPKHQNGVLILPMTARY